MGEYGPLFRWANYLTAELINLHLQSGECKAILYSKVLHTVQAAMQEAQREMIERFLAPSEN